MIKTMFTLRERDVRILDNLLSFGRFGHNRPELLRAIIAVGVSDKYYTDIALSNLGTCRGRKKQLSAYMYMNDYCALKILAHRREVTTVGFVRAMINACYYSDDYQDAVIGVLRGE